MLQKNRQLEVELSEQESRLNKQLQNQKEIERQKNVELKELRDRLQKTENDCIGYKKAYEKWREKAKELSGEKEEDQGKWHDGMMRLEFKDGYAIGVYMLGISENQKPQDAERFAQMQIEEMQGVKELIGVTWSQGHGWTMIVRFEKNVF
ncbi:hypothetical protein V2B37_15270 (plasmid) [Natranaerobius thermophilus JW/NM-WN-LF]